MRKWLRRLGIAVVLMAVASATALYSYGRFAEAARGPASHALPTAADATALDRTVAPLLRAHPGRSGMALLADNLDAFTVRAASARAAATRSRSTRSRRYGSLWLPMRSSVHRSPSLSKQSSSAQPAISTPSACLREITRSMNDGGSMPTHCMARAVRSM